MNWLKRKRIKQVFQYGWKDANEIAPLTNKGRLSIWLDIIKCFKRYYVFSNQYKAKEAWKLNDEERENILRPLGDKNCYNDDWTVWKYENAAFIEKYSQTKFGTNPELYRKRIDAYRKRYNIEDGCSISNHVVIERNHYLQGLIKIGKNALISKNVYLDYSGELIIHDNVLLANGVIVETHDHDIFTNPNVHVKIAIPSKLVIGEGAMIGSRAIILPSCHYIGKNARIGAGAVVTKDVPDYAVAVGVPAKVVKILNQE